MKTCRKLALLFVITAGIALPSSVVAAAGLGEGGLNRAEARQLIDESTPEARYKNARREAYAAYEEAKNACKQLQKSERTACLKEARSYLQDDLAYARQFLGKETSSGR